MAMANTGAGAVVLERPSQRNVFSNPMCKGSWTNEPRRNRTLFPMTVFTERKVGGKIEIGDEAEGIAKGVGYIDIDELLQQKYIP